MTTITPTVAFNQWTPTAGCSVVVTPPHGYPIASTLYYTATAGQIVFPLSVPDEFGNVGTIIDSSSLFVYRSGNRLVYIDGYTVDTPGNSVSLVYPAGANEPIVIDIVSPTATGPQGAPGTPGTPGAPGAPGPAIAMDALPISAPNTIPPLSFTPDGVVMMLLVNGAAFFAVGPDAAFTVSGSTLTWTSTLFSIPAGAAVIAVYTHA